jgi:glycosyltransferase involved in cell wall biosynthesis
MIQMNSYQNQGLLCNMVSLSSRGNPLHTGVSIVVATMNPGKQLVSCLESIFAQQGVLFEIIVIDGGSTDSTVSFLASLGEKVKYWISEPDNGIYDAWNKALPYCEMSWVQFLGSDDRFFDSRSLSKMLGAIKNKESQLVFSKIVREDRRGYSVVVGEPWDWSKHRYWQRVAHPGSLHHRDLFHRFGSFNASLKIVGDYEFLLRLPVDLPAEFYNGVTVIAGEGGISRRNVLNVFREARRVQASNITIGLWMAWAIYSYKVIKYFLGSFRHVFRWRAGDGDKEAV